MPSNHDLTAWAHQGVLLLNACLTVPAGMANGHAGQIWESFTDATSIRVVNQQEQPVVFICGVCPQEKSLITASQHLVIESAQPVSSVDAVSRQSTFSRANDFFLEAQGQTPINWLSYFNAKEQYYGNTSL